MKTILIPTDFSVNATHAAEYGYELAKSLKANVILCNAFVIPVEMPEATMVAWPMYEYDEIQKSCEDEIKNLKHHLEKKNLSLFHPDIKCYNSAGALQDVIKDIVDKEKVDLVVMGTHGATGISGVMLGNHSRRMISDATCPLLLVPAEARIAPIKKIAFASDFKDVKNDLEHIYALTKLAKALNAEILLTYIIEKEKDSKPFGKYMDDMLVNLSNKADYPHIYHKSVKSKSVESGLKWLCGHEKADLLAMVHRPYNLLDSILKGSHTQKMANHISLPLLVLPAK